MERSMVLLLLGILVLRQSKAKREAKRKAKRNERLRTRRDHRFSTGIAKLDRVYSRDASDLQAQRERREQHACLARALLRQLARPRADGKAPVTPEQRKLLTAAAASALGPADDAADEPVVQWLRTANMGPKRVQTGMEDERVQAAQMSEGYDGGDEGDT